MKKLIVLQNMLLRDIEEAINNFSDAYRLVHFMHNATPGGGPSSYVAVMEAKELTDNKVAALESRIEKLEEKLRFADGRIADLTTRLDAIEEKIDWR